MKYVQELKRFTFLIAGIASIMSLAGCGQAGGAAASSSTPVTAEAIVNHTPPPMDTGWTLATVGSEGFAIGLPPGWIQFDLTGNDLQSAMNEVMRANPQIGSGLSSQITQLTAQGIKLFAVDKYSNVKATGFATNLNVLKQEVPAGVDLDELATQSTAELKKQLGTGTTLQVMKNRLGINSGEAERLQYNWALQSPAGGSINMSVTQYLALYEGHSYIVTFATTDNEFAGYAANFDKSAKTLTFLSAK